MQQTISIKAQQHKAAARTLSATRRRKPLVILTGLNIEANYSTPIGVRITRALSAAWSWTRSNCTPRCIFSAVFSAKVSMAVAVVTVAAMWWHNIAIIDTIEAQKAVGTDCLYAMPWGIVWAYRASRMSLQEKGGVE